MMTGSARSRVLVVYSFSPLAGSCSCRLCKLTAVARRARWEHLAGGVDSRLSTPRVSRPSRSNRPRHIGGSRVIRPSDRLITLLRVTDLVFFDGIGLAPVGPGWGFLFF